MEQKISCRAAFAQVDITPGFPVELIGCYREDDRATGVLHPLLMQTLLFSFGGVRHCLITVDSLGLTRELTDELREVAAAELGADTSCVMVNFSHTHSAPAPLSPLNGGRYVALLRSAVVTCVRDALGKLMPCLAGWALGETKIAQNRRLGCTAVDKRLGALKVVGEQGDPIAVLLRLSAHANILMTENNKISSDFIGVAREKLAAEFGCPVMIVQGAAGNLKPTGVDKINGGGVNDITRVSQLLVEDAKQLRFAPREVKRLFMAERGIPLFSDVPTKGEAEKIAAESGMDGSSWLLACEELREQQVFVQEQRENIHFFFLNEGCLCGVPDEIFCELSLEAAKKTGDPLLFFNGYTDGCTGYLPHRAEWEKGGYETLYSYLLFFAYHGHVMPFRADTAARMVDEVVDVWREHRWEYN